MRVLMERVGSAASRGARQQLTQQALENARPRRHEPIPYEEFPADPDYEVELNREVEEKAPKLFRREERGLNRLLSLSYPWDREPGAGEVRMFHELEGALRRASFRERGKAKVAFDRPPGRMSGRDMVQRRAQIQMGQVPTARPWRRQVYAHTPSPTIHTLIITESRRSMNWVRRPIEGIVWAVARAVGALGGRADALTTGGWALTEAGRIPNLVPHMSTENFSGDLRLALRLGVDHLGLTTAKGVRSVFIITDTWSGYSSPTDGISIRPMITRLSPGICEGCWRPGSISPGSPSTPRAGRTVRPRLPPIWIGCPRAWPACPSPVNTTSPATWPPPSEAPSSTTPPTTQLLLRPGSSRKSITGPVMVASHDETIM